MKNFNDPRIKLETFRFLVKCLNQLRQLRVTKHITEMSACKKQVL